MMNQKKKLFVLLTLTTVLSIFTWVGVGFVAEKFPSREITIVVAFAPGGTTDLSARLLAEYLKKDLGAPVIVENRTEAQGVKGVMDVYRAKPDGYTLLANIFPRTAHQELALKAPYKILEMTYFPAFVRSYQMVIVRNDSPYKTLKDLVEASKKKPLTCSLAGVGSATHLLAEMLRRGIGLNTKVVPFKGAAPAMIALLGGNVDMTTVDELQVFQHQEKVRPLAINSDERYKKLPNVPTIKELGYDVPVVYTLIGMSGPPGMPREVHKILSDAMTKAIKNPEFIQRVEKMGSDPIYIPDREFRALGETYYKLGEEYKDIFMEKN